MPASNQYEQVFWNSWNSNQRYTVFRGQDVCGIRREGTQGSQTYSKTSRNAIKRKYTYV